MARCGCESVVAVGAAAEGSDCVTVTGAGTPASPFEIGVTVDAAADNLLSCGASGLYVPAPIVDNIDASTVVTLVGPGDADYDIGVALAPDTDMSGSNLLDLFTNGLGVASFRINVGLLDTQSAMVGAPGPPEDQFAYLIGGTELVALDASQNGQLTFPTPFPTALIAVIPVNGDAAASPPFACSLGAAALTSFNVHCEPVLDTDTVASTNVRINYIALGC